MSNMWDDVIKNAGTLLKKLREENEGREPNQKTQEAMKELEDGEGYEFDNVDDMVEELEDEE